MTLNSKVKIKISKYHGSAQKWFLDKLLGILGLPILLVVYVLIGPLIHLSDNGPIFFKQKRTGKNGGVFEVIKFRSMRVGAEKERGKKYLENLNISDGPAFKIPNDPRLTLIGQFLFKSGIDELPQIINVLRGEMSFVGPRPLPVYEADKLSSGQKNREAVLPGITSSWVTSGSHKLKFSEWMKLDRDYVKNANIHEDIVIIIKTIKMIVGKLMGKLLPLSN